MHKKQKKTLEKDTQVLFRNILYCILFILLKTTAAEIFPFVSPC